MTDHLHADFDLHGLVGVRVLGASAGDVRTVVRQLGQVQGALTRDPDIVIRFVDQLADPATLTYVEWPLSGYTSEHFYLFKGKQGVPARTRLDLASSGRACEIVCERRVGAVPHLLALVNLAMLARGVLPLHASAFIHEGRGILATGWAKGGKTELLLAFAARGATYVGDEWIYLTSEGRMFGVPEPIRLWYWHLDQLDEVRRRLPRAGRARLTALPRAAAAADRLAGWLGPGNGAASVLRRGAPVVHRQATVQVPPIELFGPDHLAPSALLDIVVLVQSRESPSVEVEEIAPDEVSGRMVASLADERAAFLAVYQQLVFAFPDRRNRQVEEASALEARLLEAALTGRRCVRLVHPYPMRMADLVQPLQAILRS